MSNYFRLVKSNFIYNKTRLLIKMSGGMFFVLNRLMFSLLQNIQLNNFSNPIHCHIRANFKEFFLTDRLGNANSVNAKHPGGFPYPARRRRNRTLVWKILQQIIQPIWQTLQYVSDLWEFHWIPKSI